MNSLEFHLIIKISRKGVKRNKIFFAPSAPLQFISYRAYAVEICLSDLTAKLRGVFRKVAQSFKIYLCVTLRFTLRNFAVKKKQYSTA
ncbi:MAG: hypothetical protein BWK80_11810 [Desulfobacteraceae bacterium IS3]|nr:MAG: hypothetical protein BWK80_11810 [Desulfobacteraceae bacterium IS3]